MNDLSLLTFFGSDVTLSLMPKLAALEDSGPSISGPSSSPSPSSSSSSSSGPAFVDAAVDPYPGISHMSHLSIECPMHVQCATILSLDSRAWNSTHIPVGTRRFDSPFLERP